MSEIYKIVKQINILQILDSSKTNITFGDFKDKVINSTSNFNNFFTIKIIFNSLHEFMDCYYYYYLKASKSITIPIKMEVFKK